MADPSERWYQLARRMRRKINCAWWLQACGTPLAVVALGLIGPVLWARHYWPDLAERWGLAAIGLAVALVLGVCWRLARRRFVTGAKALVWLEDRLGLHNRLSAAAAGACAWPAVPESLDPGIRWSASRTFLPLFAACVFLAAAWWVPVKARPQATVPDEPAAWSAIEEDIRELTRENAADPETLADIQERVAELRAQEAEKWFSHASLEATDKLREAQVSAMGNLQRQLARASESASRLAKAADALPAETRAALQDQFAQALREMQAGGMRPNPDLLEKLRQLDPELLSKIDPQQLEQIMRDMQQKAEALGKCLGRCPAPGHQDPGEDEDGQGLARNGQGDTDGEGEGPGKGGVNRGPGTSPDLFGDRSDTEANQPQFLESGDTSRSLPGDVLETTDSQHDITPVHPALRSGGKADARGGGAAWRESLHPDEQEAIKKFFE